MNNQKPIEVDLNELIKAVSQLPKMKRAPMGSKGVIPSDTLLSPDSDGLLVETSVISTFVQSSEPWGVKVSVDAKRLIEMCDRLKRIGASGKPIELSLQDRELWFRFEGTRFSLPTLWVE